MCVYMWVMCARVCIEEGRGESGLGPIYGVAEATEGDYCGVWCMCVCASRQRDIESESLELRGGAGSLGPGGASRAGLWWLVCCMFRVG